MVAETNAVRRGKIADEGGMQYLETLPRRVVTVYIPLVLFLIILLFPFYWMGITSFKPNEELYDYSKTSPFLLNHATLAHVQKLLFETSYPEWMWNTVLVSVVSTFLSLFASVCAAYAIERVRFSGSHHVGMLIFLAYLVPPSILFIPLALMVFNLGIFAFTLSWNEFIYALTFISSSENKTIPVGVLTELVEGDVYPWGSLMAGALIGSLPVAILYSFFVEHYVSSLTGAVKE